MFHPSSLKQNPNDNKDPCLNSTAHQYTMLNSCEEDVLEIGAVWQFCRAFQAVVSIELSHVLLQGAGC